MEEAKKKTRKKRGGRSKKKRTVCQWSQLNCKDYIQPDTLRRLIA